MGHIFFLFRIYYFCHTFLLLSKVLSNCIFFRKKGVSVDVGFVIKEKKGYRRYESKLSRLVYTRIWPQTFKAYFLTGMIDLFVNKRFHFSSLHARSLHWVAMVTQNFGPKSDIKIYLISFTDF